MPENTKMLSENLKRKDTKCVLILGPEFIHIDNASKEDYTGSMRDDIKDYLEKEGVIDKKFYMSEDGFFYCDNVTRESIQYKIAEYYKNFEITETYRKLVQLPFDIIISLSPDNLLEKAFRELYNVNTTDPFQVQFKKYKSEGFEEVLEVSKENPLVYNLLGECSDPDSLVYTFDSLFKFLEKLLTVADEQRPFPQKLKQYLKDAKYFVFMGFSYDKWYLKLFFYILKKIYAERASVGSNTIYEAIFNCDPQDPKIDFLSSTFKIKVSVLKQKQFIHELMSQFKPEELRQKRTKAETESEQLNTLFQNAEYEKLLRKVIDNNICDLKTTAIGILSQYNSDKRLANKSNKDGSYENKIRELIEDEILENLNNDRD